MGTIMCCKESSSLSQCLHWGLPNSAYEKYTATERERMHRCHTITQHIRQTAKAQTLTHETRSFPNIYICACAHTFLCIFCWFVKQCGLHALYIHTKHSFTMCITSHIEIVFCRSCASQSIASFDVTFYIRNRPIEPRKNICIFQTIQNYHLHDATW